MVLKGTMLACIILLCLQGVLFADCPAGSFMSADGCEECGVDHYSAAGATSCTPCPGGQLSQKGSDSVNDCYDEADAAGEEIIYLLDKVTVKEYFTKKGVIEEEGPTTTINKGYVCPEGQTKCGDIDECVPNSGLCNGGPACSNGFDESAEFCTSFECPAEQQKCADGIQCFPSSGKCDKFRYPHCNDKSDDVGCACRDGEMMCADGNGCASYLKKCDGHAQCADGSDESDDICYVSGECSIGTKKCVSGDQCVAKGSTCDGSINCLDGSDEDPDFCITYECPGYQKKCDGNKCLPVWDLCDSKPNCKDGSDEDPAFCAAYECPAAKKKCADGMQCLPKKFFCNGKTQCTDGSDESEEECAEEKGGGETVIEHGKGKGKQTIEKGERVKGVTDQESRRGPPEPVDPEPVVPIDPEPVDPEPVVPVDPEPVVPIDPEPVVPVDPEPVVPVDPEPVDPEPVVPVDPEPVVPVVPIDPVPVDPEPVVPVDPEPVVPVDPEPVVPVDPEPVVPVVPVDPEPVVPVVPVDPEPVVPVDPEPVVPVDPDPVVTVDPEPVVPVVPVVPVDPVPVVPDGKKTCDCWTPECGFCSNPECSVKLIGGLAGSKGIGVRSFLHKRKVKTIVMYKNDGDSIGQFQWSLNRISMSGCVSCHTPQRIRYKVKGLPVGTVGWRFAINDGVVELSVEGEILFTSKLTRQCAEVYGDVKSFSFTGMSCKGSFAYASEEMKLATICGGADKCPTNA
ncbi:uncharacterized protein LOC134824898 [Bolinopsis microptera]|uniref:uncharacterized protein LOC134824898 n=1 Tax=Bolinopsis microptera TaxID=2820187 RepID=UPI00307AFF87